MQDINIDRTKSSSHTYLVQNFVSLFLLKFKNSLVQKEITALIKEFFFSVSSQHFCCEGENLSKHIQNLLLDIIVIMSISRF